MNIMERARFVSDVASAVGGLFEKGGVNKYLENLQEHLE